MGMMQRVFRRRKRGRRVATGSVSSNRSRRRRVRIARKKAVCAHRMLNAALSADNKTDPKSAVLISSAFDLAAQARRMMDSSWSAQELATQQQRGEAASQEAQRIMTEDLLVRPDAQGMLAAEYAEQARLYLDSLLPRLDEESSSAALSSSSIGPLLLSQEHEIIFSAAIATAHHQNHNNNNNNDDDDDVPHSLWFQNMDGEAERALSVLSHSTRTTGSTSLQGEKLLSLYLKENPFALDTEAMRTERSKKLTPSTSSAFRRVSGGSDDGCGDPADVEQAPLSSDTTSLGDDVLDAIMKLESSGEAESLNSAIEAAAPHDYNDDEDDDATAAYRDAVARDIAFLESHHFSGDTSHEDFLNYLDSDCESMSSSLESYPRLDYPTSSSLLSSERYRIGDDQSSLNDLRKEHDMRLDQAYQLFRTTDVSDVDKMALVDLMDDDEDNSTLGDEDSLISYEKPGDPILSTRSLESMGTASWVREPPLLVAFSSAAESATDSVTDSASGDQPEEANEDVLQEMLEGSPLQSITSFLKSIPSVGSARASPDAQDGLNVEIGDEDESETIRVVFDPELLAKSLAQVSRFTDLMAQANAELQASSNASFESSQPSLPTSVNGDEASLQRCSSQEATSEFDDDEIMALILQDSSNSDRSVVRKPSDHESAAPADCLKEASSKDLRNEEHHGKDDGALSGTDKTANTNGETGQAAAAGDGSDDVKDHSCTGNQNDVSSAATPVLEAATPVFEAATPVLEAAQPEGVVTEAAREKPEPALQVDDTKSDEVMLSRIDSPSFSLQIDSMPSDEASARIPGYRRRVIRRRSQSPSIRIHGRPPKQGIRTNAGGQKDKEPAGTHRSRRLMTPSVVALRLSRCRTKKALPSPLQNPPRFVGQRKKPVRLAPSLMNQASSAHSAVQLGSRKCKLASPMDDTCGPAKARGKRGHEGYSSATCSSDDESVNSYYQRMRLERRNARGRWISSEST